MDCVLGVDGGGTGTRCLLVSTDGKIVGRGEAGGTNLNSVSDPAENLTIAIRGALGSIPPGSVVAGVLGLAGAGSANYDKAVALAAEAWSATDLPGKPDVLLDIVVAFAAGTSLPSGVVLISGTGATAARIEDTTIVARAGGYGWLVSDEGSGVWLGKQAITAALCALDGRGPQTGLVEAVLSGLGANGPDLAQAIVAKVYPPDPPRIASLAPMVELAARAGDAVAAGILREAADHLLRTVNAVGPDGPLVLAGGLLTRDSLLAGLVRSKIGLRPVSVAHDGAVGAAALALRAAGAPDEAGRRLRADSARA